VTQDDRSVRRLYEASELTLAAVAVQAGISVSTLKRKAKAGRWLRASCRPGPVLSDGTLARLKADYERGAKWESLQLAYDLSKGRLTRLVERYGWKRRRRPRSAHAAVPEARP
jgi:hypothetical protein